MDSILYNTHITYTVYTQRKISCNGFMCIFSVLSLKISIMVIFKEYANENWLAGLLR